jgi:hypothetical protein
MQCRLCETRRPRRYCLAIRADICSVCCGNEREVTLDCPLECEYLQEARKHERPRESNAEDLPNKDIRVTETFLREREDLLLFTTGMLLRAALDTPGAVDSDTGAALDSLIRTYRTTQTGLVYESRPASPVAGAIYDRLQLAFQEYRRMATENSGLSVLRDSEILGILTFLQRLEIQHANGRPRGRAFIDHLRVYFPETPAPETRPLIQT